LRQGWSQEEGGAFDGGRFDDFWNRYSELLILLFLAMGNPDTNMGIPASAWDNLTYGHGRMFPFETANITPYPANEPQHFAFVPNMPHSYVNPSIGYKNSSTELHYMHAGSLHNHQYSHLFTDFRGRVDRYQTDFFANSISATMANRQFCISLNEYAFGGDPNSADYHLQQPYDTYNENCWGLMAGIPAQVESWQPGYKAMQPIIMDWENFSVENIAVNNDSGTVLLSAPLGSTPFIPRYAIDFLRYTLTRYQANQPDGFDTLLGRYGFMNAFNLGLTFYGQRGHFPPKIIGLDMGPVVGSIENFQSGLIWNLGLRNQYIAQGMHAAGFTTEPVEPFIINFDDTPPTPHEDPNGGGVDPHSFGGSTYAFGSGDGSYVFIEDPFPGVDYGPQEYALRIEASDDNDSGVFTTLNNHGVSRWGRLSFWIKGYNGNEDFSIGIKDSVTDRLANPIESIELKLPIKEYHPDGIITNEWTAVTIPLQDFIDCNIRVEQLDNISFTCNMSQGGLVFIDDIAFLPDENAPSAPTNVTLTVSGNDVVVSWNENEEPDVVGYRIYRSNDGGITYGAQNQFLITETHYETTVLTNASLYYVTSVDNAQTQNESDPSGVVSDEVNRAPSMGTVNDRSVNVGDTLQFEVGATDPNVGDILSLSAQRADGSLLDTIGATFTDYGDRTGVFTWTPTSDQGSTQGTDYNIVFMVSDELGETDQGMATITVINTVLADSTAPEVIISEPLNNSILLSDDFYFRGTAHDISGIADIRVYVYDYSDPNIVTVINAPATYDADTETWSFHVLPAHVSLNAYARLFVRAQDNAGNWSKWQNVTIRLNQNDTQPPVLNITAPSYGDDVAETGFVFHGTVNDASGINDVRVYVYDYSTASIVTVINQPASYNASNGTWSFNVTENMISPNAYATLFVRAQDTAGNWCRWQNVFVYVPQAIIDTTAPTVSFDFPIGTTVPATGFIIGGGCSDSSGIEEVRVYVYDYGLPEIISVANEEASYNPTAQEWSFTVSAEDISNGNNCRVFVRAKDTAGNWSRWKNVVYFVVN
ncbi:glucoamylase family protein, partial [Candidatus Omnitrophota bacterium]